MCSAARSLSQRDDVDTICQGTLGFFTFGLRVARGSSHGAAGRPDGHDPKTSTQAPKSNMAVRPCSWHTLAFLPHVRKERKIGRTIMIELEDLGGLLVLPGNMIPSIWAAAKNLSGDFLGQDDAAR